MEARSTVPDYRLYRERSGEAADFWLHCEPIPERTRLHRYEIAPHRHPALFQMFRVSEGSGEVFDGRGWHRFCAPCVLFIPPGTIHGFRFTRDIDGSVVTVLADRLRALAQSDRGIAAFATHVRVVGGADADALARIGPEMSGKGAARLAALEALVSLAVVDLTRSWIASTGAGAAPPVDRRMEALHSLLAVHAREGQPLAFYAAKLGLSGTQLNRIARRAIGMTVQALADSVRLDAARRELVFTPTSVARIAETLGFADPAYFNRFFRRHTGTTPGAFREAERARLSAPARPAPTSPPS